jgi:hypothetical protein
VAFPSALAGSFTALSRSSGICRLFWVAMMPYVPAYRKCPPLEARVVAGDGHDSLRAGPCYEEPISSICVTFRNMCRVALAARE